MVKMINLIIPLQRKLTIQHSHICTVSCCTVYMMHDTSNAKLYVSNCDGCYKNGKL